MDAGKIHFVVLVGFLSLLHHCIGDPVLGAVSLNSGVFDKIISKHKAVLIKFDETYPYGAKQDTFKEVAKATISSEDVLVADVQVAVGVWHELGNIAQWGIHQLQVIMKHKAVLVKFDSDYPFSEEHDIFREIVAIARSQPDLLMAEIPVEDYGDKDNMDLAEKFSIPTKKDELPVYLLFLQGRAEPIRYSGDPLVGDDIKKFLMKESGLWLGLPACIEQFDKIVKEFLAASAEEKEELLKKAEEEAENVQLEAHKISADMYVKLMKKIIEKGTGFIESETQRLEKLTSGKLSDKKKDQLRDRLNILSSFSLSIPRDEL